jgi:type II secretory pathway pseudopilin PulG
MPRSPRTGVTALELLILVIVLGVIALYARRRFAETTVERREATLKAALREVVDEQQQYFVRHTHYAPKLDSLDVRPRAGIRITVDTASELGWRARAWTDDLPTRVCSVWYGAPEMPVGGEGVPRCADAPEERGGRR